MLKIQCPLCGSECNYVVVAGITVSCCIACYQAYIENPQVIIRIDQNKLLNKSYVQRELLAIALVMQSLYQEWEIIAKHVARSER